MSDVINQLFDGDAELIERYALRAIRVDSLQEQQGQGHGGKCERI